MDIELLNNWLEQIVQNIPILAVSMLFIGAIFVVSYKIISTQNKMIVNYIKQADTRQSEETKKKEDFRTDIYKQLEMTLDVYKEVSVALPLINSFIDKYPKIERIVNVLNQNRHSYYDFMESIISRTKYSFKMNFKNGSHEDKAMEAIDKSHEHILRTITQEDDLLHKTYHVAFADFMKAESRMLTRELLKMDEASIKLKTVDAFFTNMNSILYYYRINLSAKFLKTTPEETKKMLTSYFEGLEESEMSDLRKEIDETSRIFGF